MNLKAHHLKIALSRRKILKLLMFHLESRQLFHTEAVTYLFINACLSNYIMFIRCINGVFYDWKDGLSKMFLLTMQ